MASLADIVKGIQETNELLTSNVKAQEKIQSLMADRDRDADAARMDALGASKKTPTKATRPKGFKANFKQSSGLTGLGKVLGGVGNFASDLMGGILGKLALPIIIAAGVAFDQLVLDGKGMKKLKAWGSSIIAGIMDKLDFLDIIPDDDLLKVASSIMSAAGAGLLVALLSPQLGLMVFAGKLFADYAFDKIFTTAQQEKMKTSFHKGIQDTLGLDISEASLFKLGAGIAGLFGFGLLRSALAMAFTGVAAGGAAGGPKGGATVGRNSKGQFTKLNPKFASKFRLGFGGRLGLGLMMMSMGEQVGNYIGGALGAPDAISEVIGDSLSAAAIGFMIAGPYGALILGMGALAVAGFKAIDAWVDKRRDAVKKDLAKEIAVAQFEVDAAAPGSEEERLAKKRLKKKKYNQLANILREGQLVGGTKYSIAERIAAMGTGFRDDGTGDFVSNRGETYKGINDRLNPYNIGTENDLFRSFKKAAQDSFLRTMEDEAFLEELIKEYSAKRGFFGFGAREAVTDFSTGQGTFVDASSKDMSTHQQVHMLPATRPVTIDTYYPERGRPGFIDW